MIEVPITKGRVVIVNCDDLHRIQPFSWVFDMRRYAHTTMRVGGRRTTVQMHRFILGVSTNVEVDHINGDGLDNRRENLRIASAQQNQGNRTVGQKNNRSGFKGVRLHRGKRWIAQIKEDGKNRYLGSFGTREAAARAYNEAAIRVFGPYANLNEGV